MLIGYARVSTASKTSRYSSTRSKSPAASVASATPASGSLTARPQLAQALMGLRDGEDTLVVWRLDRLGRSLRHLIELIGELEERQLGFRSLTEGIDTTSSSRLVFHVFGAMAEFERQLIRERTQARLNAARALGSGLWPQAWLLTPRIRVISFVSSCSRKNSALQQSWCAMAV